MLPCAKSNSSMLLPGKGATIWCYCAGNGHEPLAGGAMSTAGNVCLLFFQSCHTAFGACL